MQPAPIHFQRHVPAYVDVASLPLSSNYYSTAHLLEQFAYWKDMPYFHRFSQSMERGSGMMRENRWLLMVEFKDGAEWWVLGYSDTTLGLPEWEKPRS